jgi:hypothetical protein
MVRILGNPFKSEFRFGVLTNSVSDALDTGPTQSSGARASSRSPGLTSPSLSGWCSRQVAHGPAHGPLPGCTGEKDMGIRLGRWLGFRPKAI